MVVYLLVVTMFHMSVSTKPADCYIHFLMHRIDPSAGTVYIWYIYGVKPNLMSQIDKIVCSKGSFTQFGWVLFQNVFRRPYRV